MYNDVIAQVHLRLIWLQMHFMLSLQLLTAEIIVSKAVTSVYEEKGYKLVHSISLQGMCCKVASFRQMSDISSMSQENVRLKKMLSF